MVSALEKGEGWYEINDTHPLRRGATAVSGRLLQKLSTEGEKMWKPVVLSVVFVCLAAPLPAAEITTYDDLIAAYESAPCEECHPGQHDQWQKSFHSRSIVSSLKGLRNFFAHGVPKEWGTTLSKTHVLMCLECHAPSVTMASEELAVKIAGQIVEAYDTEDPKKKEALTKSLSKLNVGCLGCHNLKAKAIAPGLLGDPGKGVIYTAGDGTTDDHKTEKINTLERSLFCAQCHGRYVAADGEQIVCNTLNGSYYNSYVPRGGTRTCQDCHMKHGERGHLFPGGHDIAIVKEGIGFSAGITGVRRKGGNYDSQAIIEVELENRAGHRIPDG